MNISNGTVGKTLKYRGDIQTLFDIEVGVKTIGEFVACVEALSQKFSSEDINNQNQNVFKGDMLEVLGELFFKSFEHDPSIGLREYDPIDLSEDFGVDGAGVNANGDMCVVQIKYRNNPLDQITYTDLAKTYTSGRCMNGFDLDKPNTIFLLTTGGSVSGSVQTVLGNRVRVIHRDIIAGFIDDNIGFWQGVDNTLTQEWKKRGLKELEQ